MEKSKMLKYYIAVSLIFLLTVAVVGYIFVVVSNPLEARGKKMDGIRRGNFREIYYEMRDYQRDKKDLPTSFSNLFKDSLRSTQSLKKRVIDPETGNEFEYHRIDQNKYSLCATFNTEYKDAYGYDEYDHGKGYQCLEFDVRDY